jgi:hypothetical protein
MCVYRGDIQQITCPSDRQSTRPRNTDKRSLRTSGANCMRPQIPSWWTQFRGILGRSSSLWLDGGGVRQGPAVGTCSSHAQTLHRERTGHKALLPERDHLGESPTVSNSSARVISLLTVHSEIYLRPFEIVVKSAQPWCMMTSYPSINGVNMDSSKHLLTDVLRNQWSYDGLIMSDWGATHTPVESVNAG